MEEEKKYYVIGIKEVHDGNVTEYFAYDGRILESDEMFEIYKNYLESENKITIEENAGKYKYLLNLKDESFIIVTKEIYSAYLKKIMDTRYKMAEFRINIYTKENFTVDEYGLLVPIESLGD